MSLVLSLAVTALVLSPVCVLAGWVQAPRKATARAKFNNSSR